jgi:hypothetical protein
MRMKLEKRIKQKAGKYMDAWDKAWEDLQDIFSKYRNKQGN